MLSNYDVSLWKLRLPVLRPRYLTGVLSRHHMLIVCDQQTINMEHRTDVPLVNSIQWTARVQSTNVICPHWVQ